MPGMSATITDSGMSFQRIFTETAESLKPVVPFSLIITSRKSASKNRSNKFGQGSTATLAELTSMSGSSLESSWIKLYSTGRRVPVLLAV